MRPKKRSPSVNHKAMINALQEKLFQWTCERHATNQPLNREILGDKVNDLSIQLGLNDFKYSKSWITTFLKKHGFSPSLTAHHGPVFKDYRDWIELMRPYITQYRYKDLFQVDEMGMYHDISPEKIAQTTEHYITCKNGEDRESRVTVLLCCNASGVEKLPPVICGRFEYQAKPVDYNCQYYTNQNAWLTPDIFKVWLSQLDAQMLQSNRKILLLLNRTRIHMLKDTVLSNVSLMFFPKNFPANLQPLKSNIFHYVKMNYRQIYTKKMVEPNFNWTMTDTISNVVKSWHSVPEELILSTFRRTNFRLDNDPLLISYPQWESLNPGISFRSYVTFDDNLYVSSTRVRRSERLAEIKTARNSATSCTLGRSHGTSYHEPIELGDSCSGESAAEEVLHSSSMSIFRHNLSVVNSYNSIADGLHGGGNRDVDNGRNLKTEVRDSDLNQSQSSRDDHECFDRTDFTCCSSSLPKTMVLYISDIAKGAIGKAVQDNAPDVVESASGFKNGAGTGDVINSLGVEEDVDATPITKKRRREESDEGDVPNDDSREPMEKKKMGEEAWSDIYEHSFVFGTSEGPPGTTSASPDVQTAFLQPAINSLKKNDDLEKKSIFTISQSSSSKSQDQ